MYKTTKKLAQYFVAGTLTFYLSNCGSNWNDNDQIILPNNPPILNSIDDKELRIGESLTFKLTATDPDKDPLRAYRKIN